MYFISVFILGSGLLLFCLKKRMRSWPELGIYMFLLLLIELFSKQLGSAFENNNLIVFSISSYLHFAFLSCIYFRLFSKSHYIWLFLYLIIGVLPAIIFNANNLKSTEEFQSYDRAIYNIVIMSYSLILIYNTLTTGEERKKVLLFNSATLLFFALDTFLAIATNYLIHANLDLVVWFWFVRAICLQLFYVSLIYLIWPDGRILKLH